MRIKEYSNDGLKFVSFVNRNNFEVIFCELGGSIFAIKDKDNYLTQTPKSVEVYKRTSIYHGKTIGRVCNRINQAQIVVDGVTYKLDMNEPHRTLHSGKDGLSTKLFAYSIKENKEYSQIIFKYLSKDLEAGFPGNVSLEVTYTFYELENNLLLNFKAISDKNTYLALTNHSYFTLNSVTLDDLYLRINAPTYIDPRKDDLIPQGVKEVDEVMDFSHAKIITKDIEDKYLIDSLTFGYDHHYCFSYVDKDVSQITLENSRYALDIYTDYSGTQIYTDNYPDEIAWEDIPSAIKRRRSIAIEPQDSTLNREILLKDTPYERFILYKFTIK